ncbi:maltose ABC transporter substrate-binding protein [Actinobacteria bacterium YIM 96077]|uniref:Maltose ABC transporter substrate-binding protein n=1 Tax=Phytoactinopolyspora halophila TaxID=1981511 RepID=A0A329QBA8_9ACTN|nr:maltose ABC transporter substrate-binding protein [Actinobacteria bacterium YIM 96077]RAW09281.1 maltose ABC transporter substrate-binding protein [Phytoactinopolyspora halophila]
MGRRSRHGLPAVALGVVMVLAACGSGSDDEASDEATAGGTGNASDEGNDDAEGEPESASEGRLLIWADNQRAPVLEPFAESFGDEYGIEVEVAAIAEDLESRFVEAAISGEGPDVVVTAHDHIGNFVQNGVIDPIDLSEDQRQLFDEVAIDVATFEGQLYAVPYAVENLALVRNTDLAPEVPESIEELVATGQELVDDGEASEIMSLQVGEEGDWYHMYPLVTSAGGYLFGRDDDGEYDPDDLGLDSPETVDAFKRIRELGESGTGALKRSIDGDNSRDFFVNGETAFHVTGPWSIADIRASDVPYEVSAIPGFEGEGPARPFLGVQAFFVASAGQNKALAQELVTNYFSQPDVALALYESEPRPPALLEALEQVSADDPDIAGFSEAARDADPMPLIPEMGAVWEPAGIASASIVGGEDVEPALDAAAETIRSVTD